MKTCAVCSKSKPITEYHNSKQSADGKAYRCKSCDSAARKKWQDANPVDFKRSQQERNWKHKYGISREDYDALLEAQGHCCAICKITDNQSGPNHIEHFCVDHCHDTGTVRGLLCNNCNRGLGLFQDDSSLLTLASEYLKQAA